MLTTTGLESTVELLQQQVRELQTEIWQLKAERTHETATTTAAVPIGRRRMLKKLAGLALAGGAVAGATLANPPVTQARIISSNNPRIGAIIRPSGAPTPTGNFQGDATYGLFVTGGTGALDLSTLSFSGLSDVGLFAYSAGATSIIASTNSGTGLLALGGSGTGVYAFGNIALTLQGRLQAIGAGINTQTCAFIHQSTAANITSNFTVIDHPHCNNQPGALLFVTHNYNPPGQPGTYDNNALGVFYKTTTPNADRWCIYHEDITQSMVAGRFYNVLIVVP
jgi:hypothetical protein